MNADNDHLWARIDAKCDLFERTLRRGDKVSIEHFLEEEWPSTHRRLLVRELVELALEYYSRNGRSVGVDDFRELLPDYQEAVDGCFQRRMQRLDQPTQSEAKSGGVRKAFRADGGLASRSVIGNYEIQEEIGRGGMGVVYRARHRQLDRTVALKVILSGDLASSEEIERFQAEARAAAQLDHSHIVPVYDVGNAGGRHFFSMGFVDGEDLGDAVARNLFEPRQAAELICKLASAIDYAHRNDILHRDLKPANVLIDRDGEPRLTDFGLAKMLNIEGASDLTRTGQLLGTPTYMSPEQARGDIAKPSPASDIYSLGAILYCSLTGRPPFRAATVVETLRQVVQDEPVSPRTINAQVDRDLETICLTCLAKEPKKRYRSSAALADDLQRYLDGQPITARPISLFSRTVRWCNRYRTRAALLATAALLVLVTVASVGYRREMLASARRLETAQELAESRQQTAETAQFYRFMQEAATLTARHEPGWTWRVTRLLRRANSLPLAAGDERLMRETIVSRDASFDLRYLRTLGDQSPGSRDLPGSMAFSSDGRYFAVGQSINEVQPKLYVYEISNFEEPRWTFSFFSGDDTTRRKRRGDQKVDNGYRSLAFSPDNRWLAAGTRFGKVLVYDLTESNAPARELDVLEDAEVKKVRFSHDSNRLYALVPDRLLRQWKDFEKPVSLEGEIGDLAVDPTGRRIAMSVGQHVEIRKELDRPVDLRLASVSPQLLDFSADGRKLAVAADDGVQQYDLTYGPTVQQVISHTSGTWEILSLHYDGKYLVTGNHEWIRVWEATSGQLLYRIPTDDFMLAMDPRGRQLAVRSVGATQLFELRQPPARIPLTGLTDSPDNVAFIGSTLTAKTGHGGKDTPGCRNYVSQWDCETGELLSTSTLLDLRGLHAYPRQGHIAASPGLAISNCQPLGLVTWRSPESSQPVEILTPLGRSISLGTSAVSAVEGSDAVSSVTTPYGHSKLVVTPNGKQIRLRVTVPVDDLPRNWHRLAITAVVECQFGANSGRGISAGFIQQTPSRASVEDFVQSFSWSASEFVGSRAAIVLKRASRSNFKTELDAMLQLDKSTVLERLEILDIVVSPLAATPDGVLHNEFNLDTPRIAADGKTVWGVLDDEVVCSWDLTEAEMRSRWEKAPAWLMHIYDLEVGEKWVYTAARNGCVQLTDPITGRLERQLPVSAQPINNIDVAADETWMIVSGDAGQVERRAVPDGRVLRQIADLDVPVTAQVLSADERWLVTGDAAGNCVLWQHIGDTYERSFALPRFDNPIRHLGLSNNNRYLSVVVLDHSAINLFDLQALNEAFSRYGVASDALSVSR